jgi:pyruvyltransferase
LSPRLVEELSGTKIQFKNLDFSISERICIVLRSLLSLNFKEFHTIRFPFQQVVVGIGSIISWVDKNGLIWGSGFMNNAESFKGGKTYAVRGKLTDDKLKKDGFSGCNVHGDPALLLPLWVKPSPIKKYRLGVIPHWKEAEYFQNAYGQKYKVIDLRTRDIDSVVDEITACEYVLSTSLHGMIVAHAYGIPALWIKKGYIDTDGFKFHDYFSSVSIPMYQGFENIEEILEKDSNWLSLFEDNTDKTQINTSLSNIQISLLSATPFQLDKKYQLLVEQHKHS